MQKPIFKTIVLQTIATLTFLYCLNAFSKEKNYFDDGVFPRVVNHESGQTILEKKPEKIAVLSTGQVDGLLTLGIIPAGATRDDRGGVLSEYLANSFACKKDELLKIKDVGTRQLVDIESLAQLKPDLILVNKAATRDSILEKYRKIAPVVVTKGRGINWRKDFITLSDAIGKPFYAQKILKDFDNLLEEFSKSNISETVSFVQTSGGRTRIMGLSSFVGDIAEKMDLKRPENQNFKKTSQDIGLENLDFADADWIFYGARGKSVDLFNNSPLWKHLDGVKNNQAIQIDFEPFFMNAGPYAARHVLNDISKAMLDKNIDMANIICGGISNE